ncbi:hypothetical protein DL770_010285 [Monosporascus sp. CRB-9-2]|nr:hypothetical protein DL770_010285 [Monosporascus sp. CRB-9-2]
MVGNSISQGLIMSLLKFSEITNALGELEKVLHEDAVEQLMAMSFEERLRVKKWELTPDEVKRSLGQQPTFIPKTGIERVRNCPSLFTAKYKPAIYQESIKMDGSWMTVYSVRKYFQWYKPPPLPPEDSTADFEGGRVSRCSPKHDLPELSEGKFWPVAFDNGLPRKLAELGRDIAIQGELGGSTISPN